MMISIIAVFLYKILLWGKKHRVMASGIQDEWGETMSNAQSMRSFGIGQIARSGREYGNSSHLLAGTPKWQQHRI